jgi:hypothetical protein
MTNPIAERLAIARARLAELKKSEPELAHTAALGSDTARKQFNAVRQEIQDTQANIELLEKASLHEAEQLKVATLARRRKERDDIKARALKIARRRPELAATLAQQLAAVIGTAKKLQSLTSDLRAAVPLREPMCVGLMLYPGEIRAAIDAEIIRIDNVPIRSAGDLDRTFPRAERASISIMQGELRSLMRPSLVDAFNESLIMLEREINTSAVFPVESSEEKSAAQNETKTMRKKSL